MTGGLVYLDDVSDEMRQLLVHLDFFLVVLETLRHTNLVVLQSHDLALDHLKGTKIYICHIQRQANEPTRSIGTLYIHIKHRCTYPQKKALLVLIGSPSSYLEVIFEKPCAADNFFDRRMQRI